MERAVYAQLSDAAYDPRKLPIEYEIDSQLSVPEALVAKHRKNGKVVIAYRGTKNWLGSDGSANWAIATRSTKTHPRFKSAYDLAARVASKYGGEKVSVTGHSLGGALARHVSEELGYGGVVFNPGSSPFGEKPLPKNLEMVRNSRDLVSYGQESEIDPLLDIWTRTPPADLLISQLGAHSLSQFK